MIFRIVFTLGLILTLPNWAKSQSDPISFEELEQIQAVQPKPLVVLIGTTWCKYCQAMKHTMLKNKEVADLLNKNYNLIFLNAEEKKDIVFIGRRFRFKPTGNKSGVHELAEHLGAINGTLSFPSICILNADNEIIFQYDGYLNAKALSLLFETANR